MTARYLRQIRITGTPIDYTEHLPAIRFLQAKGFLDFSSPVTFFAGENGTGKSTLLEAIAVINGFNAEGGSRNYRFATEQTHSALWQVLQPIREQIATDGYFLRAESFYNAASYLAELDRIPAASRKLTESYGGKSLHEQSHGESFLAYFQSFDQQGLYIMDEPEAALSPQRQLTLFIQISKMAAAGSQFIIATHSPILLGIPDAEILSFDDGTVTACEYEETESYQVMEMFINNRERLIRGLLNED